MSEQHQTSLRDIVARLLRVAEHQVGRSLTAQEKSAIEANPTELMRRLIAIGYKLPFSLSQ